MKFILFGETMPKTEFSSADCYHAVATVLTVYGIETEINARSNNFKFFKLQQYLPFTVLKPNIISPPL